MVIALSGEVSQAGGLVIFTSYASGVQIDSCATVVVLPSAGGSASLHIDPMR